MTQCDEIRFFAIDGAKTKNGGRVVANRCGMKYHEFCMAIEDDEVVYPDAPAGRIERDESTMMESIVEGVQYTVAASGTRVSNGDEIIDAGQQISAVITLINGEITCGYFDPEEIELLRAAGKI